jgi:hypothetical protein
LSARTFAIAASLAAGSSRIGIWAAMPPIAWTQRRQEICFCLLLQASRAFIGEKRRRSARPWPAMIVSSAAISTGFDKAEFADRGGDLRDLRVTVRPAVSRIGQEPINRPYCYGFGQIHRRFPRARARAFIGEKQWIGMGAAVLRIRREPIDLSSRAGARASTGEKRTSEGMNSGAWRSGAKSTAQVR